MRSSITQILPPDISSLQRRTGRVPTDFFPLPVYSSNRRNLHDGLETNKFQQLHAINPGTLVEQGAIINMVGAISLPPDDNFISISIPILPTPSGNSNNNQGGTLSLGAGVSSTIDLNTSTLTLIIDTTNTYIGDSGLVGDLTGSGTLILNANASIPTLVDISNSIDLDGNFTALPEPATFALFGLGSLALLHRRRR